MGDKNKDIVIDKSDLKDIKKIYSQGFLPVGEVANFLGISRQGVVNIRNQDESFPKGYFITKDKAIFSVEELINWVLTRERTK